MPGLYRIELQVTKGSGKLATSGLWNSAQAKEQVKIAFDYFKVNASRISASAKVLEHDFHLHVVELQSSGPLTHMALASLAAFASGLLGRPAQFQMVVLGDMSLGGSTTPVESIAECLQVTFDAGGKRVALPMSSAMDIPTIPAELLTKFQTMSIRWMRCSRRWVWIEGASYIRAKRQGSGMHGPDRAGGAAHSARQSDRFDILLALSAE